MSKTSKPPSPEQPAARVSSPRVTADEVLFTSPHVEPGAFTQTDPWRVLRIMGEFVAGFEELADLGPAVTIFGSARSRPPDRMYELAVQTAQMLGERGFAVITGAGPGIMEAANKGARTVGTLSIGLNIELPHEQHANPYLDRVVDFRYFFVRKTMLVKYSSAFIFFPGGFGTLDELFEALTLLQTGKVRDMPVILVGSEYWQGMLAWLRNVMAAQGKISPEDLEIFYVVDSPAEAVRIVVEQTRKPTTGVVP